MGSRLFGFMEQSRVPGLSQFLHGYKWMEFRIVHIGTPIHISMTWATSRKNSRRQCPEEGLPGLGLSLTPAGYQREGRQW